MIQADSRSKSDYSPSLIDGKNYSKTIPDEERADGQGQGGFFMTQSEQFIDQANSKSPLLHEKERLAIEYKKHSPRAKGLIPPATRDVINSQHQSEKLRDKLPPNNRTSQLPSVKADQFSRHSTDQPRADKDRSEVLSNRQSESSKINELTQGSLSIKGNLVHNGRCPKCTLKPPCKHFASVDDLPMVSEVQPSIKRRLEPALPSS